MSGRRGRKMRRDSGSLNTIADETNRHPEVLRRICTLDQADPSEYLRMTPAPYLDLRSSRWWIQIAQIPILRLSLFILRLVIRLARLSRPHDRLPQHRRDHLP